ncbi:type I toxin-antitoxin system Ibs family toxin [Citrobacter amalonaticus]|nr:type I toxin-antitoxin system Ibs family toxin [Citrobacter amalonaticus]MBJ9256209.1 type I toxin-antitoxin system Ibs family toxin [Citrobacter amalonaticus]MCO4159529.1 type I toxin-antitoxin system Ibs family toxin [Citrobacter amalonaticus]MDL4619150.1 type I toxin-antitoxin system Ibs family toxin [Citrobacter amalonaticus]MDL4623248.1 type I toxin-antitoxin system Ibs family toxin [Citrobacter amalonaticus]HAU5638290.1 type I toxin-antitoxin system Ibs family toxin [Citrobacter amalo
MMKLVIILVILLVISFHTY